jgi:hypothetical protein
MPVIVCGTSFETNGAGFELIYRSTKKSIARNSRRHAKTLAKAARKPFPANRSKHISWNAPGGLFNALCLFASTR